MLTPERFEPHFGIDESGKGDFFGPLVIAGVYVDRAIARALIDAGRAGQQTHQLRRENPRPGPASSRRCPARRTASSAIGPERYNALQQKMRNVNNLLGWGHARVIENLLEQRPDCPRSLSDQFANPSIIKRSLLEKGRRIQLDQRTKAESDPAVAAASILARERFIDWLEAAGRAHGVVLPRGASAQVKAAARQLIGKAVGGDPAAAGEDPFPHRAGDRAGGVRRRWKHSPEPSRRSGLTREIAGTSNP